MEKLNQAQRALATLTAILHEPVTVIVRDAAIQRFEYTSEAVWKAAQWYLKTAHGVVEGSPRGCYKRLFQLGTVDAELAAALQAVVDDRNLTAHTYVEDIAQTVFERLPQHTRTFTLLLSHLT